MVACDSEYSRSLVRKDPPPQHTLLFKSYTEAWSLAPGEPVHQDGPIGSQSYRDVDIDLCWKC
jgi:hypothetical protein